MRIDRASRLMVAAPDIVYQAFATAQAMAEWLPPKGMTASILAFDFREGGSYRMRLSYDTPGHAAGKTSENMDEVVVCFMKLVPGRRIEQAVRFASERPEFAGEMRMVWTFDPASQGTRVAVSCENVPAGISAEDHAAGLDSTLDNLAAFTGR